MTTTRRCFLAFIFFTGSTITSLHCIGQSRDRNIKEWARQMGSKDYEIGDTSLNQPYRQLIKFETARMSGLLDSLEQEGKSKGDYFTVRFNVLKASCILDKLVPENPYNENYPANIDSVRKVLKELYANAIDIAYRTEDDHLIAWTSYRYGSGISRIDETGLAVMYAKNGIDLYEKLNKPIRDGAYQFLAAILYRVKEYDQCRIYSKKATAAWKASLNEDKRATANCINTTALTFHRQEQYDSAFYYYNEALQIAREAKDSVWTGIISGNKGQVFYALGQYDTAYQLFKMDVAISEKYELYHNAANSLQWASRTSLALGKKNRALTEVREAFQLLRLWPDANYLRNTYHAATQIFKEAGDYDSAFYYNNLWSTINDSLERVVATSSLAISQARMNDEKSRYNIHNLNKEKRAQIFYRNIIIASIIVLSIISFLIINRQRLKEKLKNEKVEREKIQMEQEVAFAREQMRIFTENIIEKTNLIEKLESQLQGSQATEEQQAIISELCRQTILTEEDWLRFKSLFEKINPLFFIILKEKFPDITLAEQRMTALIRLHLSTKEIASMLGISVDSVHKSRQRLRQRFQVSTETNLEELVNNF